MGWAMTRQGERYWRLHVELQAMPPDRLDGPEGESLRSQRDSLWGVLPEKDKEEIRDRLKVATGG